MLNNTPTVLSECKTGKVLEISCKHAKTLVVTDEHVNFVTFLWYTKNIHKTCIIFYDGI